jgi:hypothetical protein
MGNIELSEERMQNVTRGLLAINISPNTVCEHSFIAYIDKNLVVRDCFMTDFTIEIPETPSKPRDEQEVEQKLIPEKDELDMDLIKMNISALLITHILRGCFLNKNTIIINEKKFLNKHVINFLKHITQNTFNSNVSVISKEDYQNNKKLYKKDLVLDDKKIVNDREKIIGGKKLNIERKIVQKYLAENDQTASLIVLKNEIHIAYELSKTIADFIENSESIDEITSKKIIDKIKLIHDIRVQIPYLNFLLEIVENYFEVEVPDISGVSNFLGSL